MKFFFIASTGVPNLSEFVAALVIDEILVGHCDINKKVVETKQDWMKKILENDPQQMEYYSRHCFENQPNSFKATFYTLNQLFNQSGGTVCDMLYFILYC